jgi:hypothetical protein
MTTKLDAESVLTFIRSRKDGCTMAELKEAFDAAGAITAEIFPPSFVVSSVSPKFADVLRKLILSGNVGALGPKLFPLATPPLPPSTKRRRRKRKRTSNPKAPLPIRGGQTKHNSITRGIQE